MHGCKTIISQMIEVFYWHQIVDASLDGKKWCRKCCGKKLLPGAVGKCIDRQIGTIQRS